MKCGVTETETCLKSVTLALLDGTNVRKRKLNIPLSISNLKHLLTFLLYCHIVHTGDQSGFRWKY